MEIWKHLRAILLLPGMVLVVIPGTILYLTGLDTFDLWQQVQATRLVLPILGSVFIALGLALMVATIRLFVTVGKGTLAPWNPTQRLVVQGVYRHVRNPMISGVMFILLGEVLLSASVPLLVWFAFFVATNIVYIPLAEEPRLGFTIWRRLRGLQTERAKMDSEGEGVGGVMVETPPGIRIRFGIRFSRQIAILGES
jgi:protein-S-isoprenylcysteine O-methyltransferase Ste14